jgi:DNA-binding response OmpR family regulator
MLRRILVVDDDPQVPNLVDRYLRTECEVAAAGTGEIALNYICSRPPDMLILDLGLPGATGWDVLERAREAGYEGKVIILTADISVDAETLAFERGVDDFVTKPFDLRFRARVLARLNEARKLLCDRIISGTVVLDRHTYRVWIDGNAVHLRPMGFKLLWTLIEAGDRVQSTAELLQVVWVVSAAIKSGTVKTHIGQLRAKLRPFGLDRCIVTVPKAGYSWRAEEESPRMS